MRIPLFSIRENNVYERGKASLIPLEEYDVLSRCPKCRFGPIVYKPGVAFKINADAYKASEVVLPDLMDVWWMFTFALRVEYCEIVAKFDPTVKFETLTIKDRSKKLASEIENDFRLVIPKRLPVLINDKNTVSNVVCDLCRDRNFEFVDIWRQELDSRIVQSENGIGVTIPETLIGELQMFRYDRYIIGLESLAAALRKAGMKSLLTLHFGHMVGYDMSMELYVKEHRRCSEKRLPGTTGFSYDSPLRLT